jgi:peptide/nickel transport system substrate-binding protein
MRVFGILLSVSALLVACFGSGTAAAENVLRWASATEALTFDPHSANHLPTQVENSQVYEPLVDFNSSYEIEPSLAIGWQLIDPTTWQFDLRRRVRFHDGTPSTAQDVVFSLNRAMSKASDFREDVSSIAAVEAIDDHTVRVTTVAPNPILPDHLGQIGMMSKRWAEQHDALLPAVYGDETETYAERHANGTGPFKLVSFEVGVGAVMSRSPDWWGLGQNPHNLDRMFTR